MRLVPFAAAGYNLLRGAWAVIAPLHVWRLFDRAGTRRGPPQPRCARGVVAGMASATTRIGFGGGCHWCTEAVFQALRGVARVEQGWASALDAPERFSEAVIVYFDAREIPLDVLVAVHLHTHSCTSGHALRGRYRSAVYARDDAQAAAARAALEASRADFEAPVVTEVVRLGGFRQNEPRYRDYYRTDPTRPFCERYIAPKLAEVRRRFGRYA